MERNHEFLLTGAGLASDYTVIHWVVETPSGTVERTGRFACAAVARASALSGCRALVLVTPQARARWYETMAEELTSEGLLPEPVEIPDGQSLDEIYRVLQVLAERLPHGAAVRLDITHSMRHLPLVCFAALLFLRSSLELEIRGIHYGAMVAPGDAKPVLDLTGLLELIDWSHAVTQARDAGDWRQVARRLDEDAGRLFKLGKGQAWLGKTRDMAGHLATAYAAALPLETGLAAARLLEALEKLRPVDSPLAAAATSIASSLRAVAAQLAIEGAAKKVKKEIALDRPELQRQLAMVRAKLDAGNVPQALLLMGEWLVNYWLCRKGTNREWLAYGSARKPSELALHSLVERHRKGLATSDESSIGQAWDRVKQLRNAVAHAGYREEDVRPSIPMAEDLLRDCERLLAGSLAPCPRNSHGGVTLISPLGLSPGVLFSALTHVQPSRVVVLASARSKDAVDEAVSRYGRSLQPPRVLTMEDPHRGFREANKWCQDPDLLDLLGESSNVVLNITGGTTVMQYAAERLGDAARRLGVAVRTIALIDRRPLEQQRADPFQPSELLQLESAGGLSLPVMHPEESENV